MKLTQAGKRRICPYRRHQILFPRLARHVPSQSFACSAQACGLIHCTPAPGLFSASRRRVGTIVAAAEMSWDEMVAGTVWRIPALEHAAEALAAVRSIGIFMLQPHYHAGPPDVA